MLLHSTRTPLGLLFALIFSICFSANTLAQTNANQSKPAPSEIAFINLVASVQANKPIRKRFNRSFQYAASHIPNSLMALKQNNQIRFNNNVFYLPTHQEIKPEIKLVHYDFDNLNESCLRQADPEIIKKIEQNALVIVGAVSSDCTKSLLQHPGFADIPILNSMSTAVHLSKDAFHLHDNLFRTTFPDHYSVTKLIEEVQANVGREDLRSFNFGLLYNAKSDYSSGLKNESYKQLGELGGMYNLPVLNEENDNNEDPNQTSAVQQHHNIQLINMDKIINCEQLALPIHNMLILNYNAKMQSDIERINACHHDNSSAIPQYFAIGSPELFKNLPPQSVVVSRPNLEQFENINKQFHDIADKALLSSSTYLMTETLFAALNHLIGKPPKTWRETLKPFLRNERMQSSLNQSYFQFDSHGELISNLPSSSIYQLNASYELKNRLLGKDSTLELISINQANRIGWFDGSLQMKIVVPSSFKDKSVTLRIERDSQIERLLNHATQKLLGAESDDAEPRKNSIHNEDILLDRLNNGVYQYLPWVMGNYRITIANSNGDIISNEVEYVVAAPIHLLITLFVACAVGLLLLERNLHQKMKHPIALIRYFAGIVITATVLHLLSVTFRNSDIASFMPFLSFSSNLVTNGVIIGILAGLNGLELIHTFLANIQSRFVPTTDISSDPAINARTAPTSAPTSAQTAQPAQSHQGT